MTKCDAGESLLARLEVTPTRTRTATKTDPIQRAKVRYCSCCTRATHIAVPPRRDSGEFSWYKDRGLPQWKSHGPEYYRAGASDLRV